MKNKIQKSLLIVMVCAVLALTGCGTKAAATQSTTAQTAAQPSEAAVAAAVSTQPASATSLDTYQLLFGILKLKGTDQEVTKEQAAALLPLWTNYQTLTASMGPGQNGGQSGQNNDQSQQAPQDTPSADQQPEMSEQQTQLNDILTQVQAILTADQVSAIQALQLKEDRDSMQTLISDLGITVSNDQPQGGDGSQPQGGGPGGAPGDNAGGNPPSGGNAPAISGTPGANGGQQPGGGMMINSSVLQALIDYLTTRSA